VIAKVRRWGNSLAVRLPLRVLQAMGVTEGDTVQIEVARAPAGGLDLSTLPTFRDSDRRASVNHDRYLYGPRARRR